MKLLLLLPLFFAIALARIDISSHNPLGGTSKFIILPPGSTPSPTPSPIETPPPSPLPCDQCEIGKPCSDRNPCTELDTCLPTVLGNICVGRKPRQCPPLPNECFEEPLWEPNCDDRVCRCRFAFKPVGAPCGIRRVCNGQGRCINPNRVAELAPLEESEQSERAYSVDRELVEEELEAAEASELAERRQELAATEAAWEAHEAAFEASEAAAEAREAKIREEHAKRHHEHAHHGKHHHRVQREESSESGEESSESSRHH